MTFKKKFEMVIKYQQVMILVQKIYRDDEYNAKKITFLTRNEKLSKICALYSNTKKMLYQAFINSLPDDFKLIYMNLFPNKKVDSKWYLKYFSKSTYYRKLGQLLDLILLITI